LRALITLGASIAGRTLRTGGTLGSLVTLLTGFTILTLITSHTTDATDGTSATSLAGNTHHAILACRSCETGGPTRVQQIDIHGILATAEEIFVVHAREVAATRGGKTLGVQGGRVVPRVTEASIRETKEPVTEGRGHVCALAGWHLASGAVEVHGLVPSRVLELKTVEVEEAAAGGD
jgi:hypothetical protein